MIDQQSYAPTKQEIQKKLCQLQTLLSECDNTDTLNAVNTHIGNAINVLKAFNSQYQIRKLPTKRNYPSNKKNEIQCRFFSTRLKRRKISSNVLSKPNVNQARLCYKHLQQMETDLCGICLQHEDSKDTNEDDILWVSCNKCSIWVHASCSNMTNTLSEDYTCMYCVSNTPKSPGLN